MSILSPVSFLSSYLDNNECELFRERDHIVAYVPTRDEWEAEIHFTTDNYTEAEQTARAMGLEPKWN